MIQIFLTTKALDKLERFSLNVLIDSSHNVNMISWTQASKTTKRKVEVL